jgi:ATPase family associated with various cellular activities (AAA)
MMRAETTDGLTRVAELDRRLTRDFERLRAIGSDPANSFRGLYIDETEVAGLLADTAGRAIEQVDETRLDELQRTFGLEALDLDILVAALAPDLDPVYERVYAFLQDDITKKRPTVGLLLRLLCSPPEAASAARRRFHPAAPLFRSRLLGYGDEAPGDAPLLAAAPRADERVVAHLLGTDALDGRLLGSTRYEPAPEPRPFARAATDAVARAAEGSARLLALVGPASAGKTDAARLFAATLGRGLLVVDTPALLGSTACPPPQAVGLVLREALLLSTVTYWSRADSLWAEGEFAAATRRALLIGAHTGLPSLLSGDTKWEPPPVLAGHAIVRVNVPIPTAAEREASWRAELGADAVPELDAAIRNAAASFRLTAGQIAEAVVVARAAARVRGDRSLRPHDLSAGGRALSGRRLAALGQEVTPRADWNHLILPADSTRQLRELCVTVRHRDRVLEQWGFGRRLSGGKGVTALFAGTSGTGKTMAAEVVARDLELALFRIDLAGIVSKWIGETEKNLDRVFEAAWDSNAILFFDEADALFGKRSEVKDSHDRYANLEISYLLQKMETYEGLAILATNMRQQIDDAFLRRLTFNVIFPLPEEADRVRIWAAVWPAELPRADDVDFARLARIKLAGGNIKNVLLAAAHLAAAQDRAVTLEDLLMGMRREYQKLGKQVPLEELALAVDESAD